ncbi:MAG: exodeoxyribonuclease VII large subunit [Candidatus Moranbacteria bacterium]|nr:exodeoxyribonuclease VII large subunit [Candidatus Moranbacteria bacterium]
MKGEVKVCFVLNNKPKPIGATGYLYFMKKNNKNNQHNQEESLPLFDFQDKKLNSKSSASVRKKPKIKSKKNNKKKVSNQDLDFLYSKQEQKQEKIFSVSDFLSFTNQKLAGQNYKIKGEIGRFQKRGGYAFFSLKDKKDESVLNCFIWADVLRVCAVELEEGMEVLVYGYLEIYKRTGNLNLQVRSVELVGEGVLKKAFEKLKLKLEKEGLFDEKIKRPVPEFSKKIALITSRHGQAINDFNTNIGGFGFKISFLDCRVEGQRSVFDLIEAVKFFNKNPKDYDVLVLIRGGGSWESLQSFNNEELARTIRKSKIPVVCGVGHEGDITIADLVSDFRCSTPTGAAKKIAESWISAKDKLDNYESSIFNEFDYHLTQKRLAMDKLASFLSQRYAKIFDWFRLMEDSVKRGFDRLKFKTKEQKVDLEEKQKAVFQNFSVLIKAKKEFLAQLENQIKNSDPKRQLKLGYNIAFLKGKVVKSVKQLKKNDLIKMKFFDGKADSKITKIDKKT